MNELTSEHLRSLLDYDMETGVFTWKVHRSSHVRAGSRAGCDNSQGYTLICIEGRRYRAARLAWFWVTGSWPSEFVDHINGDKADDRFCNLREASRAQNNSNRRQRRTSTNPYKGVARIGNRWAARIKKNRRDIHLGMFATPEQAHKAYHEASTKLHGEFARFE